MVILGDFDFDTPILLIICGFSKAFFAAGFYIQKMR